MLFVGDDWAEDHHDVEVQNEAGKILTRARLAEGVEGMARLHELVAKHLPDDADPGQEVLICIETDKGPWVHALLAAGYRVYAVNPKLAARHRELLSLSGAKSDKGDANMLADLVRTRRHQLREVAPDSDNAAAIKMAARAHQSMIWERTRHMLRMRAALLEYFPAALEAYKSLELTGPDTLELLAKAPTPDQAAKLTISQISASLRRVHRHDVAAKAAAIQKTLRTPHLTQPEVVAQAYATTVRTEAAVLRVLVEQIKVLEGEVETLFGRHPDAELYRSQPGLGAVLGARVLAEFGDAPDRYASAKARKNYAGTSPITRQSGKTKSVHARFVHNDRLLDALHQQAGAAIIHDSEANAYYRQLRAREITHNSALRQLANRLVGILHGCIKSGTPYDSDIAWAHRKENQAA